MFNLATFNKNLMGKFNVTGFFLFKKLDQCVIRFYINLVENRINLIQTLKNSSKGSLLHVYG